MILWLAVIVAALLGALLLPCGVELRSANGRHRAYLYWAGLRFPLKSRVQPEAAEPEPPQFLRTLLQLKQRDLALLWRHLGTDLPWLAGVMQRFRKAVRIRVRYLHIVVASPDPALTGFAYGAACAITAALPRHWPVAVAVDFTVERPAVDYRVVIVAVPLRILGILVVSLTEFVMNRLPRRTRPAAQP